MVVGVREGTSQNVDESGPLSPSRFWLAASQIGASLSNIVVIGFAAGFLDTANVGEVGVLLATYFFALAIVRGLVSEPALLNLSIGQAKDDSAGAALALGAIISLLAALPLFHLVKGGNAPVVVMLAALPFLVVQDTLRYVAFAQKNPRPAGMSDLFWILFTTVSVAPIAIFGNLKLVHLVSVWAAGGVLGAVLLVRSLHISSLFSARKMQSAVKSLNVSRRLRAATSIDSIATLGVLQVATFEVATFGGLEAAGVTRFVQTVFGPVSLVFATMYVEGLWAADSDPAERNRIVTKKVFDIAKALCLASAFVTVAFLFVPDDLGVRLQGRTFLASQTPILFYALAQLPSAIATGAVFGLRAVNHLEAAARIRLVWAVLIVLATPFGAAKGASGFFVTLGIANLIGAVLWWRCFRKHTEPSFANPSALNETTP
jgi:hypothetical protein